MDYTRDAVDAVLLLWQQFWCRLYPGLFLLCDPGVILPHPSSLECKVVKAQMETDNCVCSVGTKSIINADLKSMI